MTAITDEFVVDGQTGELVPYQPPQQAMTLFGTDDPVAVLEASTAVAIALATKVREQELVMKIGQGEHVKNEGWTMLGGMLGVYAVPINDDGPELVEINGAIGFKSTMKVITRNGDLVGGGTSYCMQSESRWRNADIYALAGMAQTRAVSRALKVPLGFVMKMAGFETTPAEEMLDAEKPKPAAKSKDKTAKMRADIKELAVQADAKRGETKTAGEVEVAFKSLGTTLAKATEEELLRVGQELGAWYGAGCEGSYELAPFD